MEGFHRAETPFSVRPGAAQQGSGASLFMHRPHRRRQPVRPPNQTAAPASLALLKHDGFNLASLYQSRCPELAHLPRVASGVCVRVRWLGCCRWCIDVGFFLFCSWPQIANMELWSPVAARGRRSPDRTGAPDMPEHGLISGGARTTSRCGVGGEGVEGCNGSRNRSRGSSGPPCPPCPP